MDKNNKKTIRSDNQDYTTSHEEEYGYSTTEEIAKRTFSGEISTKLHAYLKVIDSEERGKHIELGETEVIIGRSPECGLQISVKNVSRKHARILYRNEEYRIEDLGSTNGIYINGIKVAKCVLKNRDLIEIGEMKMIFIEELISNHPKPYL
ncbi:FHA domain-containing protein [Thermodesulfobacteriota bacterium]